ncbi:hypothetical protein [Pseudomonas typographi]|uniref:hypothetical protein n=1 Tax=Pseudomonas typographi TaxID=2715964 RepID=UPI001683D074|nr:hypothetical protein [Pseudomonas typographi]MBD1554762.1 hypothetical protein [Pseudomonas typographi]
MAVGDLDGDIPSTYASRDPKRQTSFDITNTDPRYLKSLGPVARAAQQIPAGPVSNLATAGQGVDPSAPPMRVLNDLSNLNGQYGVQPKPSVSAAGNAGAQAAQSYSMPNLATGIQQNPQMFLDKLPTLPKPQPSNLSDWTSTGIGANAQGGAIAARVGANGVPEFSNQQAAQGIANLRDVLQTTPGQSPDPNAPLASLGSAANLGDGQGTFSQAQPGDAALAQSRFNRASQLRQDYANQDRLRDALAANTRANNFTEVRDSSKPLTRDDLIKSQMDQQQRVSRLEDIGMASGIIDSTQQQRAGDLQNRQASRLEDLFNAATGPGATQEAVGAYTRAIDPTGQKALAAAKTAAEIKKTNAETGAIGAKAVQSQVDKANVQAGQLATFDQALGSVDKILGTQVDPNNPNGPRKDEDPGLSKSLGRIDGLLPTLPGSPAADFQARLDTLKAQTFLPQVAALKGTGALSDAEGKKLSDSIGALSTKMSEDAFRKSLGEVRQSLAAARERAVKANGGISPQQPAAAQQSGPAVGSVSQGYVFLGGDPASPSSWRKQ